MVTNGSNASGHLAILVGGGPAPGLNSAISSVTIEARNSGLDVLGIYDGFAHLIEGSTEHVRPLQIEDVSRIHSTGGSILRTARANPTKSPEAMQNVVDVLKRLGVGYLVTIGGDDTAFAAGSVCRAAGGALKVAHVPKTIDNDLPLPANMPTFGYETARYVGTEIVLTLMEDSRTTVRWFVVVVMGRKAGHLALGIGKAAGATVTVIPEEFPRPQITLDDIARVVEGSILKRRLSTHNYGVAIVAEGVGERIDIEELRKASGGEIGTDPYGHVSLSDIPLAQLIKQRVQKRMADRGDKVHLTDVTLGYELRCRDPIPFDIDYTRTLGYAAVRFLLDPQTDERLADGGFVCLDGPDLRVMPFNELLDPATGRTRVRLVDVNSVQYKVARDYMIRLDPADLADDTTCARLAQSTGMSVEAFRAEYGAVVAETVPL